MIWIGLVAQPGLAYGELVAPLVISGAGFAMAIPATQSAVLGAVAPADLGRASGVFSTARQLGGAFGVAVLVAVFAGRGGYASAQAFSDGFADACVASAALALLAGAAGLALPRRRRARAAPALAAEGASSRC
jgi:hypothetical protein